MIPIITTLNPKILVGKCLTMSFAQNTTQELWKSFMPVRNLITSAAGTNLYSLQVYPQGHFMNFNPAVQFVKWAAVEVASLHNTPDGMEAFNLPGGLYAVFHYKGNPANGAEVFSYIYQTWLPQSDYELDNRPHFEILGSKYKQGSDDSEEDIWIPIKLSDK